MPGADQVCSLRLRTSAHHLVHLRGTEHAVFAEYGQGGDRDALPFGPARLSEANHHLLHDVSGEARAQAVGGALEVGHPGSRQR